MPDHRDQDRGTGNVRQEGAPDAVVLLLRACWSPTFVARFPIAYAWTAARPTVMASPIRTVFQALIPASPRVPSYPAGSPPRASRAQRVSPWAGDGAPARERPCRAVAAEGRTPGPRGPPWAPRDSVRYGRDSAGQPLGGRSSPAHALSGAAAYRIGTPWDHLGAQGSRIWTGCHGGAARVPSASGFPGEDTSHSVHPVPFVQRGCPFR